MIGHTKRRAQERGVLKRAAKVAIVVKVHWLDLILSGRKDWEIRVSSTARRGWIHLAESKATGQLMGRVRLDDCMALTRESFMEHAMHHCVESVQEINYRKIYAWCLKEPERFAKPLRYHHLPAAVIWVNTRRRPMPCSPQYHPQFSAA